MKKILLLLLIISFNYSFCQVLQNENFNALSIGNIGTDLTGVTAGQGSYYTYIAASGQNSDFQIINEDATYQNVLQLTGSNTDSNSRTLWKDGLATSWSSRTVGNDIIQVEYDFYTGPVTTSKNQTRIVVYDASGTKMLAGIQMYQDSKIIRGLSYYDNAGTLNNYNFQVSTSDIVLTANTWVRVGFAFNKTNGEVTWKGPGFSRTITGASVGIDPDRLYVILAPGTGNTLSSTTKFDNINVEAVATESLLNINNDVYLDNNIAIYPNPINDEFSILNSSNLNIESINISDINGRTIKNINVNSIENINISDLNSGVYFLNITSDSGSATKKIIKN